MMFVRGQTAILLVVFTLLSACMAVAPPAPGQLNLTEPNREFTRVWRDYPDMDARFSRTGARRSLEQVRAIAIGDTKAALTARIGQPVLAQADGSWDFNLSLPLRGTQRLICQYRVYFDDQDRVRGSIWRRPQCADLVLGRAA